eukprot:351834-Chlamydomonas_euryale.AAC.1
MALQPAVHRAGGSSEMSVGAGDAGASEAANRMAITPERSPSPRVLVAFDFDHTVVDANSDTWRHLGAQLGLWWTPTGTPGCTGRPMVDANSDTWVH